MTPRELTQTALEIASTDPATARTYFHEAATLWVALGEPRLAAFCLHQSAGLALHMGDSPVTDLAAAAQLLRHHLEARAVVLLDLGHALKLEGDRRRARLILQESVKAALQAGNQSVNAEARELLRLVEAERMGIDLTAAMQRHSPLLADEQLRAGMTLSPTLRQRAERQQVREIEVEAELARIKREMKKQSDGGRR